MLAMTLNLHGDAHRTISRALGFSPQEYTAIPLLVLPMMRFSDPIMKCRTDGSPSSWQSHRSRTCRTVVVEVSMYTPGYYKQTSRQEKFMIKIVSGGHAICDAIICLAMESVFLFLCVGPASSVMPVPEAGHQGL
jgi:hypothetical protein